MNRRTAKKVLLLIVCALFIVTALLSATFVFTHTHHEHAHGGPNGNCAVCTHLAIAGNLLKFLAGALVCAAVGFSGFSAIRSVPKAACFRAALSTLVQQKIKLNI